MSIKVSIVEDKAGIRKSLAILINGSSGFECISTFPNAEVALEEMRNNWPEVVLMDINLPEISGIDCAKKLKEIRPTLQIIMLTVYVENEKIFKSLMAGASGYLIKDTPPTEILEAIADVHRGGSPMSSQIARRVVEHVQQFSMSDETMNLSPREYEILGQLAKGYQYKEIADKLGISPLTVRTHLRNIYEKLHVRSRTEAVVKFLGKGEKRDR
ncbi:MAG: response regulator transcription factor [Verrucomicrobiota bacterium]|nr:response regulator transcription factor [Verrucomicrobiota bacterium]